MRPPSCAPLRRPVVPRIEFEPAVVARPSELPSFLAHYEPEDRLERAIRTGRVWCDTDQPVEIRDFDAREDILSLGPKTLVSGTLTTLMTGAVVGLLTVS